MTRITRPIRITRTIRIPPSADFKTLYQVSLAEWQAMPTLHSGQFDNLKFENENFRVWTSRMRSDDYGDNQEAYSAERLTFEQLINGAWRRLDRYGRLIERCACASGAHGDIEGPLEDCPKHGRR